MIIVTIMVIVIIIIIICNATAVTRAVTEARFQGRPITLHEINEALVDNEGSEDGFSDEDKTALEEEV